MSGLRTSRRTTSTSTSPCPDEKGRTAPGAAAVLLVGHGSHLSPASSEPIHALAERLRDLRWFREIQVAFWKEEPLLHFAFDLVETHAVYVVPVFTSRGYFTEQVLPREMGLEGSLTLRGGRRIHLCDPLGSHPRVADVVLERADEAVSLSQGEASDAHLVVVGHGTTHHPTSGEATLNLVDALSREGRYRRVASAFLDQRPTLDDVLGETGEGDAIVVPFFISKGWHAGTTIPQGLFEEAGAAGSKRGQVFYSEPVGTHPAMADVVRDLIRDAEARGEALLEHERRDHPDPLPATLAKEAFLDEVRSTDGEPIPVLQTVARQSSPGVFEVRHAMDRDLPPRDLMSLRGPRELGEVTRFTDEGRYRPLRTAPDLPHGWLLGGLTGDLLWEAYAQLYPAVLVHRFLGALGQLGVVSFEEAARRQTGMYAGLETLDDSAVEALVAECCSPHRCLREPTWSDANAERSSAGGYPCPQPCALFLSAARAAPRGTTHGDS